MEATVGYRGINFANVPVVTRIVDADGVERDVRIAATDGAEQGVSAKTDALSVFGHFAAGVTPGSGTTIGKYFATGVAAQKLADKAGEGLGMAMAISAVDPKMPGAAVAQTAAAVSSAPKGNAAAAATAANAAADAAESAERAAQSGGNQ